MDKKSRTSRITLIILIVIVACAVLCLILFLRFGGVTMLLPNRIVMGTAVRYQPPAPSVENVVQASVENTPVETSTPQLLDTITAVFTLTPFPPTATPTLPDSAACVPANQRDKAIVVKMLDGESIQVVMHEKTYTIRYIGIHTPLFGLKSEPFGSEAANFNKTLVQNQMVILVRDSTEKNESGDLLRYVFAGDRFVNLDLVRQGFAQAVSAPPDTSCDAVFLQAQQSAQQERLGQWKDFIATGFPTLTPTIDLTASPTTRVAAGLCDCKGPDLDCTDFSTRADAQACYDYCKKLGFGDIFLIDIDHDGLACINKRP
jgi:endonuclease YncB( thermonuclease family)